MPRAPSWATSFADLALLLLAFFVILHSGAQHAVLAGARETLNAAPTSSGPLVLVRSAEQLFEPGEARLRPGAHAELVAFGRGATRVRIESRGFDPAGRRFDRWELAAARAAAVARTIAAGGVPEGRVELTMPSSAGTADGQQLSLLAQRPAR